MSNSKLKPRYGIFGAERLKDATFTGRFDFPFTPGTILHESALEGIPFDHISDRAIPEGSVLHFYVHDRRFLRFVENPDRWMGRLERFPRIIGLDHSVYRDLPLAEQVHSLYLNRAMDWDLHSRGKTVIPNATWGDWRTFDFCFDGIERGRTVAVSSLGTCQLRAAKYHFLQGLVELLDRLRPPSIVFHGPIFPEAQEVLADRSVRIIAMRTRVDEAFRKEVRHEQV